MPVPFVQNYETFSFNFRMSFHQHNRRAGATRCVKLNMVHNMIKNVKVNDSHCLIYSLEDKVWNLLMIEGIDPRNESSSELKLFLEGMLEVFLSRLPSLRIRRYLSETSHYRSSESLGPSTVFDLYQLIFILHDIAHRDYSIPTSLHSDAYNTHKWYS